MDDAGRHVLLDRWFRDHADRVLAYLLHRTDPETAQDVLQEVFVTAFCRAPAVPDPPIGWLLGTARRALANATRGARRRDRLTARLSAQPADAGAAEGGSDQDVMDALDSLSAADREVLTLSAWYELPAEEAARALGCSVAAYRVRLHRARRRLAEVLVAAAPSLTVEVPDVR